MMTHENSLYDFCCVGYEKLLTDLYALKPLHFGTVYRVKHAKKIRIGQWRVDFYHSLHSRFHG